MRLVIVARRMHSGGRVVAGRSPSPEIGMTQTGAMDFLIIQFLNGLASASSLFLVAAGLSIIFGVTRIVNFAHGSFYMLGAYLAVSLTGRLGGATSAVGFWLSLLLAALIVAGIGALVEILLLRRIYKAPELFQLLATFGVVLIVGQLVVIVWGPDALIGPRAPGLDGSVEILGQRFPQYELLLIGLGPAVLGGLTWLFRAHPVRHSGARRDPGSRDGGRARRRPGKAVHGACSRSAPASPRSAARCSCRAMRSPTTWICGSSRMPSWSWWSAAWAASLAPISRRC